MSRLAPPEGLRTTMEAPEGATSIVLVRHGQGEVNVSGRIGGHEACTGLTDEGRAQVAAMAARLAATGELDNADVLLASRLGRAQETAAILAPSVGRHPDELVIDCDLCELHPGEADGLLWEEYVDRYEPRDFDVSPGDPFAPGGESWNGFVDRVGRTMERIASDHQGQLVVVATHAGVIEASMLRLLAGSPEGGPHRRLRLQTEHASLTEWEHSRFGWRLKRYNDART